MNDLDRYQGFLRRQAHRLKLVHRRGASGREIGAAWTLVVDLVFQHVARAAARSHPEGGHSRWTLVATGGYGRRELNPGSDIDVLFLHASPPGAQPQEAPFLELLDPPVVFTLFPKLGHAVRTVGECVDLARNDLASLTSLLEARPVFGSPDLYAELERAILSQCLEGHEGAWLEVRLKEQAARRARHGDTVCLQEPNVKNGCGGLRDYQGLRWIAGLLYRDPSLAALAARGWLEEADIGVLEAAYDFLLRVRNELHYHTGRASDVLTRHVQPAVAHNLGCTDRSLSRRVELFMRDYYRHARQIHLLSRSVDQQLQRHFSRRMAPDPQTGTPGAPSAGPPPALPRTPAVDGFRFDHGEVAARDEGVFREEPARLLRVFRHAQQRRLALSPSLARLIRREVADLGPVLRRDPHAPPTFLEILNQRGRVAPSLESMHELGVLGAYLPAFGRLTCLVQHEFFHRYTADEHTLMCIRRLDEIAVARDGPLLPYAEIFQKEIAQPFLLYLALLLHDAGKAAPDGSHAVAGSRIAAGVARRLGLDAATTNSLCQLVRQHLDMIVVSQRRDLDEPSEIRRFALSVGSVDQLNRLVLLTIADSLGTSERLWNGFKDTLLLTLHWRTRALLAGTPEAAVAESRQREQLLARVRSALPAEVGDDEIEAHFAAMPDRYVRQRAVGEMIADIETVHQFLLRAAAGEDADPLEPASAWHHDPDRGFSVVRVATWDRPGLFSRICGALTAAGLNILNAEIFTRTDAIALDRFAVVDATSGSVAGPREQHRFTVHVREALCRGADLQEAILRRLRSRSLLLPAPTEPVPTTIRFDNASAPDRTVIEIDAQDRPGLLYRLTQVLAELELDTVLARINTDKDAASDTFYVRQKGGGRIEDPARLREIETRLRAAV